MAEEDIPKIPTETCAIVAGSLAGGLLASGGRNEAQAINLFYSIYGKLLRRQIPPTPEAEEPEITPLPPLNERG
jgi:hypothetical protein